MVSPVAHRNWDPTDESKKRTGQQITNGDRAKPQRKEKYSHAKGETNRQPLKETEHSSGLIRHVNPSRCRTTELTRRREFTNPSPDQSSCETCSRRSRPTIGCARPTGVTG